MIALLRLAVAAALLQAPIGALSAAANAQSAGDLPAASSAAPAEGPVSHDEIRTALAKLSGDSNLAGRQTSRVLRWGHPQASPGNTPSWARGLAGFLAQWMNVLFWAGGLAAVGSAALALIRWLRALPPAADPRSGAPALGVGRSGLDADALPSDVGAAALTLLEAQRIREALALLYRGALSRAVHRHGVVIRESCTESEALRAVNAHLDPQGAAYVAELIGVRERAVYAGETAPHETLERLCRGFAPALEGAAS